MSRRAAFEITRDYIREINCAPDASSICAIVLNRTRKFGFERLLAGTMPNPGSSPIHQKSHVLLEQWPAEWVERYFSEGYLFDDPTIRRVRAAERPFFWSDLHEGRDDPCAARVMNEATEFGLKAGLTISVGTLEGDMAGFSLAGERIEVPPESIEMIRLLATYGIGRSIMLLEGRSDAPVHLTPREREVLLWSAEGKTDWEIGEIVGFSSHASEKHMRSVMMKLNATNRLHAVAKALRRGLIE
jgi:LuxR family quorum sensing-dependent transcriptional regulator